MSLSQSTKTPIVALQMDPFPTINPTTDTTLALALEAQKRGMRLFQYTPNHLVYDSGKVWAMGDFVRVYDDETHWYDVIQPAVKLPLEEASFVLVRQNPPFDMAYLTNTHLLELLPSTTRVINDPVGIRNAPEKLLVTHLPDLAPPTLITQDRAAMDAFIETHQHVVIKPLYDFGGAAVFSLKAGDANKNSLFELFAKMYAEPPILQKFIPEVSQGDKRIILINGQPAGIFTRVPPEHQVRSNMRVGGTPQPCDFTERDREICARLTPILQERGLFLVGIDVIGDYLTEINVTSPTGMRAMQRLYGYNLTELFWDEVGK